MTLAEALLFFPHTKEDDLQDLYEERLFEYKQFFLSKFPVKKVFLAKEKKMLQMHEAFTTLGGRIETQKLTLPAFTFYFTENILESFHTYQRYRNELKNALIQSVSAFEITPLINGLLQLQFEYCCNWPEIEVLATDGITISNEPDPMILLASILEFNKQGGFTYEDLIGKRNISPILLINEAKRLSLCRKLEKNG